MQTETQTTKSAEPVTPVTLFDESYRELVLGEFSQSQRAWMRIFSDMQEANARWCARRQEMIRDSAALLLHANAADPGSAAKAWRDWANASAHRLIDDVADQMEISLRAMARMGDSAPAGSAFEPAAKPRRAKARANGEVTHH